MTGIRSHFHHELEDLERTIMVMATQVEEMVEKAVNALVSGDIDLANQVIQADEAIDQHHMDIHNRWMLLMARQQPMATDLRLLSAILHLNTTLERTGDQCKNISKLAVLCADLPTRDRISEMVREMGDLVRPMIRTAADAFLRRDADEARLLPAMDEPVDRLNRSMYHEVVECGPDPKLLEWATHMMMAARALERVGDQAVDVAEQVAFLVTGDFQEFQSPKPGV